MAEVLSQSQIDALLNSLSENAAPIDEIQREESEKKVRKYDFYSPKKFTKDRLKLINSIYDNYARIAASQINSIFRTSSDISVIAVEEQRYYEFTNALSDNDVITLVDAKLPDHSKNPPVIVYASRALILNLIDRMLGGVGAISYVDPFYTYTQIELALYEQILKYIIAVMKDAWASYINISFTYERKEENPSMFQEIGMDETVVIVMLEVILREDISERINVCIPGNLLVNVFHIMDRKKNMANGSETDMETTRSVIMDNIRNSPLDVVAQMTPASITMEDVYRLHEGDVIDLGQPRDSDISLLIEGQPWFRGQLGIHKKNVAIKIEDYASEEQTQ